MALLKSQALELEEMQRDEASECYRLLHAWAPKSPVITPIVTLPARQAKTDDKPFGYDYSRTPSRSRRHRVFSEV